MYKRDTYCRSLYSLRKQHSYLFSKKPVSSILIRRVGAFSFVDALYREPVNPVAQDTLQNLTFLFKHIIGLFPLSTVTGWTLSTLLIVLLCFIS